MELPAHAWPRPWRIAAAVLVAWMRVAPLVLLALLLFTDVRLSNPLRLVRTYALYCLLPAVLYRILAWRYRATVLLNGRELTIEDARHKAIVPLESIAGLLPWWPPLPSPGLVVALQSGRRFDREIGLADPAKLFESLPVAEGLQMERPHLALRWAYGGSAQAWWERPELRIVAFALVPALPLFNLHQWITYGGTFGEYYIYGLGPYLIAFGIYWAMAAVWLALYDAALHAIAELFLLGCAFAARRPTASLRRIVRRVRLSLYFLAVPAFLIRLYLLSRV
jgi:apolipoprotein N-acyltransferase